MKQPLYCSKEQRDKIRDEYSRKLKTREQLREEYPFLSDHAIKVILNGIKVWDSKGRIPKELIKEYCERYKKGEITRDEICAEIKEAYPFFSKRYVMNWLYARGIIIRDKKRELKKNINRNSQVIKKWEFTPYTEEELRAMTTNYSRYERLILSYNKQ